MRNVYQGYQAFGNQDYLFLLVRLSSKYFGNILVIFKIYFALKNVILFNNLDDNLVLLILEVFTGTINYNVNNDKDKLDQMTKNYHCKC